MATSHFLASIWSEFISAGAQFSSKKMMKSVGEAVSIMGPSAASMTGGCLMTT
jgi:hypothetical protein